MADAITGSCLCGQVAFDIDNDFRFLFFCHCRQCRKISGSAHIAHLSSETESLVWTRGQDLVKRFDLPGRSFSKAYCQICATALPYRSNDSGRILVPAGCLDGEPKVRHTARIFMSECSAWASQVGDAPTFSGYPAYFSNDDR